MVKAQQIYLNYKCPKCGKYFSLKTKEEYKSKMSHQIVEGYVQDGMNLFDHECNERGESIHYYLISHSEKPLKDAVKVINDYR